MQDMKELARMGSSARERIRRVLHPLADIGAGPWRVDDECRAHRHNTLRAAKLKRPVRCICPRSQQLLQDNYRRERARMGFGGEAELMAKGSVNGLPGGGPWLIKADCPGLLHNTQNAALKGAKHLRCICPRGLALRRAGLDAVNARRAAKGVTQPGNAGRAASGSRSGSLPTYLANVRDAGAFPSLPPGGKCQSRYGLSVVDAYFAEKAGSAAAHQQMCGSCPLREQCAAVVLKFEKPAGSWGGMYAGMDVAERRRVMARVTEVRR